MKRTMFVSLCCIAGFLGGCKPADEVRSASGGSKGSEVGVVDLDKVARDMLWADKMSADFKMADDSVKAQLTDHIKQISEIFNKKRDDIIANATGGNADKKDKILKATSREALISAGLTGKEVDDLSLAASNLANEQRQAQSAYEQIMQARRGQTVQSFRQLLIPIVQRVAAANGRLLVVQNPSDNVLFSDPSVDISPKVVEELQKSQIKMPELPPQPKITWTAPTTAPAAP